MADKKDKTMKNASQWTENELELFAEVLADPENKFAFSLEKLALKNWESEIGTFLAQIILKQLFV